jgi:hypothetical protein
METTYCTTATDSLDGSAVLVCINSLAQTRHCRQLAIRAKGGAGKSFADSVTETEGRRSTSSGVENPGQMEERFHQPGPHDLYRFGSQ